MSRKTKTQTQHKAEEIEAMFEQKSGNGAAYDPASAQKPHGAQEQDPKRRIGQFNGTGEPPLMKK